MFFSKTHGHRCCYSKWPMLWPPPNLDYVPKGPPGVAGTLGGEPADDLARRRDVAKWMSIHFYLIHNPYSPNDPSLLPFPRKVATGPLLSFTSEIAMLCRILPFISLFSSPPIFFPLGAPCSCLLLGLELSLSLCAVLKAPWIFVSCSHLLSFNRRSRSVSLPASPGHLAQDIPQVLL